MRKFYFKDFEVSHITKKTLKNSYIQIDKNSQIIIKTPKVSDVYVQELLKSKENWIREKIAISSSLVKPILQDEVLLFGEIVSIDKIEVLQKSLNSVLVDEKQKILKTYDMYYKTYASEYLLNRLEYFANMMNLSYKELRIKKLKSRWGSCDSLRRITLNQELLKIKKELIDYVVVHELAHLVHMNHSKNFHALVRSYLPTADLLRKELKTIPLHKLLFDE